MALLIKLPWQFALQCCLSAGRFSLFELGHKDISPDTESLSKVNMITRLNYSQTNRFS